MSARIAVILVLAVLPGLAAGQDTKRGLQFVTVDGLVGGSAHPERTGPTFYESPSIPEARIAIAVRLGTRGAFRPVAAIDYSGAWGRGDEVSICLPAPNGSCLQRFPSLSGVAVGLGVRWAVGNVLTFGLTGGVGRYTVKGREKSTGYHAQAEISARFMKHAGAVLNVRHVEAEEFQNARMWYRPITVGIRIQ